MKNVEKVIKIQISNRLKPFYVLASRAMSLITHYTRNPCKTHYICTAAQIQILYEALNKLITFDK